MSKLLSFKVQGRESWGVVVGDDVADLGQAFPQYPTLQSYIAADRLARAEADAAEAPVRIKLADIDYLPVITQPEKIICAVRNYLDHHQEVTAAGLLRTPHQRH